MIPRNMNFFDRLERRWGWLAFPGFLRYYALFQVLVFVLRLFRPDISAILAFDREKILQGEVWRVATFFFADGDFGPPGIISILLLIFAVNFVFMVSDGLEGAWGCFKATLFYYTGILFALLANFVYPFPVPYSGMTLFAASLLAFATLFPRVEILLYFIIPIQIRFIGILTGLGILLAMIQSPILIPFFGMTLMNYLTWVAIPTLRGTARVLDASKRKQRFNAAKLPNAAAFHTCAVCQKTDVSDPHLEFRIGRNGEEYCTDHLPETDV